MAADRRGMSVSAREPATTPRANCRRQVVLVHVPAPLRSASRYRCSAYICVARQVRARRLRLFSRRRNAGCDDPRPAAISDAHGFLVRRARQLCGWRRAIAMMIGDGTAMDWTSILIVMVIPSLCGFAIQSCLASGVVGASVLLAHLVRAATAGACGLNGRALDRAVRAKHTTVSALGPQQLVAGPAFVKINARISRHRFNRHRPTCRAREGGFKNGRRRHNQRPTIASGPAGATRCKPAPGSRQQTREFAPRAWQTCRQRRVPGAPRSRRRLKRQWRLL